MDFWGPGEESFLALQPAEPLATTLRAGARAVLVFAGDLDEARIATLKVFLLKGSERLPVFCVDLHVLEQKPSAENCGHRHKEDAKKRTQNSFGKVFSTHMEVGCSREDHVRKLCAHLD